MEHCSGNSRASKSLINPSCIFLNLRWIIEWGVMMFFISVEAFFVFISCIHKWASTVFGIFVVRDCFLSSIGWNSKLFVMVVLLMFILIWMLMIMTIRAFN
jgi:hypothetical protein